jgi:4-hydroxybenzoate polyprenyltransferase
MPRQVFSNYLSLITFSHTVFALPFALIGFMLGAREAGYRFDWQLPLLVLLCMVFARSAAMAFNRWADRRYDALNERTRRREIPAGVISARAALVFAFVCSGLFVACTWFINPLCFALSPVALAVVLGYSYTKRFTAFSHFVLGLGLSLAPIGAFLAVTGEFGLLPVLFSLSVLAWVSGFDIIYALQDVEFDRSNKLKSIPARLGIRHALRTSSALHVAASAVLLLASFHGDLGWIYLCGWGAFSILLLYQHLIVSERDLSRVNMAFFTTNGVAGILLSVFVAIDLA